MNLGLCFLFSVSLQQPSTNGTKAPIIQLRKTKNQARESLAIVHCREKLEDSNFEADCLWGYFRREKMTLEQDNRTLKSQRAVTNKTLTWTPPKDKERDFFSGKHWHQHVTCHRDRETQCRRIVTIWKEQQLQGKLKTNGERAKTTDVFP